MKKRLFRVAMVLVSVFCLLAVLAGILVRCIVSEDFLVGRIQKSINSKVTIGDLHLSIFSFPARITLDDVSFSPRGLDTPEGCAPVQIRKISFSVSLWGLLRHHIHITGITIHGANITTIHRKDGTSTLGELFASPRKKGHKKLGKCKGSSSNVFGQEDFLTTLAGLLVEDSRVDITLEATGLRFRCTGVNIESGAIGTDTDKLEKTNTNKLRLAGKVRMDSTDGWHYGDVYLTGELAVRVFNPVTGGIDPDIMGDFSLGKNSWLNTRVPFITRAWGHLSVLEPLGVKVAALPDRATFGGSEAITVHYHSGRVTVLKPLSLWMADWKLSAMEGSWLRAQTDQHEIRGELLASKSASTHFRILMAKGERFLPGRVHALVAADIEKQMFRDDRLRVKIKSSGYFSNPRVRPDGALADYAKAARKAVRKLTKEKAGEFLRSLLDKGGKRRE